MRIPALLIVCLFMVQAVSVGAERMVKSITWPTRNASPAAKLGEDKESLLALMRLGVSAFSEASMMKLTFIGGRALGLSGKRAGALQPLVVTRYNKIAADEVFSKAPSGLKYCFSEVKPKLGLCSVYVPGVVNEETDVIIFLHGYGGSFVFYLHYLAEVFPNHVIVCPAYGISCSHISSVYLQGCLGAVSKELVVKLKKPLLIGLSAGGFGGFREYSRRAGAYVGYVSMAAYVPMNVIGKTPRNGRIRLVAGADEGFVKNGTWRRNGRVLKHRAADSGFKLIANQGHFFMLSAEEETKKLLKKWDAELQKVKL